MEYRLVYTLYCHKFSLCTNFTANVQTLLSLHIASQNKALINNQPSTNSAANDTQGEKIIKHQGLRAAYVTKV